MSHAGTTTGTPRGTDAVSPASPTRAATHPIRNFTSFVTTHPLRQISSSADMTRASHDDSRPANDPQMNPEPTLFELAAATPTAEPLSADRRRTLRQKANIDAGRHPLTGGPTLNDGSTCGSCKHRIHVHGGARSYPKCDLWGGNHSAATDVRAWWPACGKWVAR